MKFDFCIGNPPYQEETEGTRDKPVYDCFMDAAYNVANKVELITPARFLFNAGATAKTWNEKMLNDEHLKVLEYEPVATNCFPNVGFKGGVAITYRDADKSFGKIEMYSIYEEMNSIRFKLNQEGTKSLSDIMFGQGSYKFSDIMHKENPQIRYQEDASGNNIGILSRGHDMDIATSAFERLSDIVFFDSKDLKDDEIIIVGRKDNVRKEMHIKRKYIAEHPNLQKYKVLLPKANGTGAFGETLSEPISYGPNTGHTQTFLSIGVFDTKKEADNTIKYIKTKFCRALLGIKKVTQDNPPEKWKYVPLQDFTDQSDINWNTSIANIDKQLYKKYGLSDEEINFIETNVKEMK